MRFNIDRNFFYGGKKRLESEVEFQSITAMKFYCLKEYKVTYWVDNSKESIGHRADDYPYLIVTVTKN